MKVLARSFEIMRTGGPQCTDNSVQTWTFFAPFSAILEVWLWEQKGRKTASFLLEKYETYFHRVMLTRVEVKSKSCKNKRRRRVLPQLSRVLANRPRGLSKLTENKETFSIQYFFMVVSYPSRVGYNERYHIVSRSQYKLRSENLDLRKIKRKTGDEPYGSPL